MSETSKTSIQAREQLLSDFAQQPNDPELWDQAYAMVRADGDLAIDDSSIAALVPTEELIAYADAMRTTPRANRYALTAARNSTGERWFDTLTTFSSPQNARAKLAAIESVFGPGQHTGRALDVGTGTGKSLGNLETTFSEVVGLDRNATLLKVAGEIKRDDTLLVRSEVTTLPFAAESFELISSSGLASALDKGATIAFYKELARTLVPGGIYLDGSWIENEDGYLGKESTEITRTAKAMLCDMIVDSTSGNLELVDHLIWDEERTNLLNSLGLEHHAWLVDDAVYNDGTQTIITALQKRS